MTSRPGRAGDLPGLIVGIVMLPAILCPGPTWAQDSLRIRVLELPGHLPVAGALVLAGSGTRRLTGPDGHVSISPIGPGPYRLSVERLGFASADTIVERTASLITIALTPRPLSIPGIQVNAPPGEPFASLGGEVRVRTPERTVHARGIGLDPLEELASSGIAATTSDFSAIPIVRSSRWDQGALFLGPLRMWGPHHGLGLVGPARTSGTEEVRVGGVVPPLEFANTTGSVLRAEPRSAGTSRWIRSSLSLLDGTVSVGGPLGPKEDGEFVVTGSRSIDSGLLGGIVGGGLPFRYGSIEAHASLRLAPSFLVRVSGYGSDDEVAFDASAYSEDLESRWSSRAFATALHWTVRTGSSLGIAVAGSRYRTRLASLIAGEPGPLTRGDVTDYRFSALWSQHLSAATLKLGLAAAHLETGVRSAEGAPGPALDGRDQVRGVAALIGLETVRGSSALRLGLRVDAPDLDEVLVQPRIEWTREVARTWRVHASGGASAQWISALNAETTIPQAPIWWLQTGELEVTTSWSAGVGITGPVTPEVRVRAELFGARLQGLTRWRQPWTEAAGIVQEPGRSAGLGLDLVLWEGRSANLRWDHTLAWASVGEERRAPPWDVRYSGNLGVAWRPGGWDVAASVAYASGRPLPTPIGQLPGLDLAAPFGLQYGGLHAIEDEAPRRLPAYFRVDLGVARDLDVFGSDWQISLKVLNLTEHLNTLYYRLGNDGWLTRFDGPTARGPALWGQSLHPVRQFPRLVSLGISIHVR